MVIRIVDGPIATTEAMASHIRERLVRALARFERLIPVVEVHLTDINGPCGGIDKLCAIHVSVRRAGRIIVRECRDEFYRAIDAAIHRVKQAIARRADRRKRRAAH